MPMPAYPIGCYTPGCPNPAVYKIAARWSDGRLGELKTYGLCCPACLGKCFAQSRRKQAACRLAPGETLEPPGIYTLERGQRDRKLHRLEELEKKLLEEEAENRPGELKKQRMGEEEHESNRRDIQSGQ